MSKPRIKPYIAIDLETTGLANNAMVLEIAMIADDGVSPVEELKTISVGIKYDLYTYAEPTALIMNAELIKKNHETDYGKTPEEALNLIAEFMSDFQTTYFMNGEKAERFQLAGKNIAKSDIPWMQNLITQVAGAHITEQFNAMLSHRTIDVGSMYFEDFGENVGLNKINELTGRKPVRHTGLDDCYDVVYAIRKKME